MLAAFGMVRSCISVILKLLWIISGYVMTLGTIFFSVRYKKHKIKETSKILTI